MMKGSKAGPKFLVGLVAVAAIIAVFVWLADGRILAGGAATATASPRPVMLAEDEMAEEPGIEQPIVVHEVYETDAPEGESTPEDDSDEALEAYAKTMGAMAERSFAAAQPVQQYTQKRGMTEAEQTTYLEVAGKIATEIAKNDLDFLPPAMPPKEQGGMTVEDLLGDSAELSFYAHRDDEFGDDTIMVLDINHDGNQISLGHFGNVRAYNCSYISVVWNVRENRARDYENAWEFVVPNNEAYGGGIWTTDQYPVLSEDSGEPVDPPRTITASLNAMQVGVMLSIIDNVAAGRDWYN